VSEGERAVIGTGAAPGRAVGPAFVLASDGDVTDMPAGAILVARLIHPFQAPLFLRVAAVVAEQGGLLQHTATLAREFGIPAVVGLPEATTIFRTGESLEVNGDTGEVRRAD
jgi:phosphohistidine swiveling domain-containing protein